LSPVAVSRPRWTSLASPARSLRSGGGRWQDALDALSTVSVNGQAFTSSKPAYERQILVRSPGYPKLSWAVEGQYPLLLNLYDVAHEIRDRGEAGATAFDAQIAELQQALNAQTTVYRERIDRVAALMDEVAGKLTAAAGC